MMWEVWRVVDVELGVGVLEYGGGKLPKPLGN